MFVCPHCQFENPSQNRFCQRCGNALRALRAIIIPTGSDLEPRPEAKAKETTAPLATTTAPSLTSQSVSTVADLLTANHQLKEETRYQLRSEADAQQPLSGAEMVLPVLDCQPADDSPLLQFLEAVPDDIGEADIDNLIPPMAFPYWKLQEQLYPVVPELQAAWQTGEYTITVIEDRSTWRTLTDLAKAGVVEPLEFVHWFYEMLTLWTALSTFEAESSLLDPENIRVDDDQVVCLQRLLFNLSDRPPTLKTLGQFWQTWLTDLLPSQMVTLNDLVKAMARGEIREVAAVKEHLAKIADQLQEIAVTARPGTAPPPAPMADASALDSVAIAPTDTTAADTTAAETSARAEDASGADAMPILTMDELLATSDLEDFEATAAVDDGSDDGELNDLPTMALPMKLYRLDEVGRTHVGRQRSHNEDSFFAETQLNRLDSPAGTELKARGLYILCDGMGGHSGGEVASCLAVTTLRDYFAEHWQDDLPDDEVIKAGILQANQAIFDENESEARSGSARMGTTLVIVLVADQQVVAAHVGDSRLYCLNRQGLTQVTVDHEVGQREINRGVEPAIAYARPDAYQLTQALGPRSNQEVMPSITRLTVSQDTLFLLCSDGLSDNDLLETHVESYLEPMMRSRADLEEGMANLIDLANEHNGHDNITAVAVRFKLRPNLDAT